MRALTSLWRALGLMLLLAACASGEVDGPGTIWLGDSPPEGPVVASTETASARHELFREPDGCLVHGVSVAGFSPLYERFCTWDELNFARATGGCFYDPAKAGEPAAECDAILEPVLYGILPSPIAHLCIGRFEGPPTRIVDPTVISPPSNAPFIVPSPAPLPVSPVPFTESGLLYSESPVDTDVDHLLAECARVGPFEAAQPATILLDVRAPSGLDPDATVHVDFGLGPAGFSLGALSEPAGLDYRADPAATTFRVGFGDEPRWVTLSLPPGLHLEAGREAAATLVLPESGDPSDVELLAG